MMNLDNTIKDLQKALSEILPNSGLTPEQKASVGKIMNGSASIASLMGKIDIDNTNIDSLLKDAISKQQTIEQQFNDLKDGINSNR